MQQLEFQEIFLLFFLFFVLNCGFDMNFACGSEKSGLYIG